MISAPQVCYGHFEIFSHGLQQDGDQQMKPRGGRKECNATHAQLFGAVKVMQTEISRGKAEKKRGFCACIDRTLWAFSAVLVAFTGGL